MVFVNHKKLTKNVYSYILCHTRHDQNDKVVIANVANDAFEKFDKNEIACHLLQLQEGGGESNKYGKMLVYLK